MKSFDVTLEYLIVSAEKMNKYLVLGTSSGFILGKPVTDDSTSDELKQLYKDTRTTSAKESKKYNLNITDLLLEDVSIHLSGSIPTANMPFTFVDKNDITYVALADHPNLE